MPPRSTNAPYSVMFFTVPVTITELALGAEIKVPTHRGPAVTVRVPPGTRSRPHYHEGCESALYMLSGSVRIRWGDHLEQQLEVEPGDMLYVPPRVTHIVENVSDTEPADYVVARDSPHEDAVVVPWAEE